MTGWKATGLACALAVAIAGPATARPAFDRADDRGGGGVVAEPALALPYLECVPYARRVSGIALYGDALTWWDQAQGRYARGRVPRVGAVMSFAPHGRMELGHVAAVSRVVDARTVLLRHANWSPIAGRRGWIEDDVRAVDVSPDNDWSAVRVWYAPLGDLGTTSWPVNGFIYNRPIDRRPIDSRPISYRPLAAAGPAPARAAALPAPASPLPASASPRVRPSRIGADFLAGIVPETRKAPRPRPPARTTLAFDSDPIGRIIASRQR